MKLGIPLLLSLVLFTGCSLKTNEERQILIIVTDFMKAVQNDDETAAQAILLDLSAFRTLNPDVSARVDASSFTDGVLSDLISNYRNMVGYFNHKKIIVKSLRLGGSWYQYKGFPAFKDNVIELQVEEETVEFTIRGLVRVGDKWRIVDLSDNGLF